MLESESGFRNPDSCTREPQILRIRTCGGLHLEDAILNGEERDIEGAAAYVVDEHVPLAAGFLVQAVSDGYQW